MTYLPYPSVPGQVQIDLREARLLVSTELNRVNVVLWRILPTYGMFRRDDWIAIDDHCLATYDQISSTCRQSFQVCGIQADQLTWTLYLQRGCDGGSGDEEVLGAVIHSLPYGLAGDYSRLRPTGQALSSLDWTLSPNGSESRWNFYEGERVPEAHRLELQLNARGDGGQDIRAVTSDTSSWQGSLPSRGDGGEFRLYRRGASGEDWRLRSNVRWGGGHGEWTDYPLEGDAVVRTW